MSNEMKLLMAFIEASGFEVEVEYDYDETEISHDVFMEMTGPPYVNSYFGDNAYHVSAHGGEWERSPSGGYYKKLKEPRVSYKVKPKS